jgi:hypothetical protein
MVRRSDAEETVIVSSPLTLRFSDLGLLTEEPAGGEDVYTVNIHVAPDAPASLVKTSYNKTTDVLTLDAN